ncbi:50S ribosomal protein L15 [Candidatus Daviesbacteria bacterium]|nr:50S ribosomal protein L15 [Candidatus Daviesbacteria bacterium]
MKLHQVLKSKRRSNKRIGRGVGSGKGKTAGRGTKGQKARGKIPVGLPGAGLPTFKKLPKRVGLGNRRVSVKPKPITLSKLNIFKKNSLVDLEQLFKVNIIDKEDLAKGVKILADGGLTVSLVVKLPVSKKAKMEIEHKGGKVEYA